LSSINEFLNLVMKSTWLLIIWFILDAIGTIQ
jgi:hypothetical protein